MAEDLEYVASPRGDVVNDPIVRGLEDLQKVKNKLYIMSITCHM